MILFLIKRLAKKGGSILFDISVFKDMNEEEKYKNLLLMLEGLTSGEENMVTKLSNASALINALVDRINWCGFYLTEGENLVLGPFQGMPACTFIKIGEGVCGRALKDKKVIRVSDVHSFCDHIACDKASNSEIVIPIIKDNKVLGVLDMDSPYIGRFNDIDQYYLEKCVGIIVKNIF